jgi:hypothetical protein
MKQPGLDLTLICQSEPNGTTFLAEEVWYNFHFYGRNFHILKTTRQPGWPESANPNAVRFACWLGG